MAVTDRAFNPSGKESVDKIKAAVLELEQVITAECPAGRRKAMALTELETASMWAVKSVFEP